MLVIQEKSNLLKLYSLDGYLRREFDEGAVSEVDSSLDRKDGSAHEEAEQPKSETQVAALPASNEVCAVDGKRTFGHSLASVQLAFTCLYIAVNSAEYVITVDLHKCTSGLAIWLEKPCKNSAKISG